MPTARVTLRMPRVLSASIRKAAKQKNQSVIAYIRNALEQECDMPDDIAIDMVSNLKPLVRKRDEVLKLIATNIFKVRTEAAGFPETATPCWEVYLIDAQAALDVINSLE